jgi:pyruvate carboxylase
MSGLTSQPALNSVVAALEFTERSTDLNLENLEKISEYWESIRPVYAKFESGLKSGSASIYKYEIPGGQYSNLKPQVESFGIGHRFDDVKEMFKEVNDMLGDIVKVTPSSKAVGDMAIFMVQNDLNKDNIIEKGKDMAFPDSIVSYFEGMMGQPLGGFPVELQNIVLKGKEPITCRPGELLAPVDFDETKDHLEEKYNREFDEKEILSYILYPKVFEDYLKDLKEQGNLSRIASHVFFYGLREGETSEVQIAEGKTLIVKLLEIGKVDNEGNRVLIFEVNDSTRVVKISDKNSNITKDIIVKQKANPDDISEIGASIPGRVAKILVNVGDKVSMNQTVVIIEAMKMETSITSSMDGIVKSIGIKEGQLIESGELLMRLENK